MKDASRQSRSSRVTWRPRYAVERNFGRLPPTRASARQPGRRRFVRARPCAASRRAAGACVYEPDGTFVRSYGAGRIFDSHGISIDARDRVWIADRDAHQILVFDLAGEPVLRLGERHRPRWTRPFNHPTRAAVAPDGEIYVADGYGNARIHRFSADGELRVELRRGRPGPGQFMTPHSVIIDRQDRLLVCDRENDRVQIFDRDGGWLAEWSGLCRPMDLCERDDGVILVTDRAACG